MRWPFVFAVHALCVLYSTMAEDCLLNSPLEFHDLKDGDRKQVTLSGNQLTITPIGSADRLLATALGVAMRSARLILRALASYCFHHTYAIQFEKYFRNEGLACGFGSLHLFTFMYSCTIYTSHAEIYTVADVIFIVWLSFLTHGNPVTRNVHFWQLDCARHDGSDILQRFRGLQRTWKTKPTAK